MSLPSTPGRSAATTKRSASSWMSTCGIQLTLAHRRCQRSGSGPDRAAGASGSRAPRARNGDGHEKSPLNEVNLKNRCARRALDRMCGRRVSFKSPRGGAADVASPGAAAQLTAAGGAQAAVSVAKAASACGAGCVGGGARIAAALGRGLQAGQKVIAGPCRPGEGRASVRSLCKTCARPEHNILGSGGCGDKRRVFIEIDRASCGR